MTDICLFVCHYFSFVKGWSAAENKVSLTLSLTKMAEHCRGTPIILWGFQVTELALHKGAKQSTQPSVCVGVVFPTVSAYNRKHGLSEINKYDNNNNTH